MDLTTITAADFKAQFPRDFPYAPSANADVNKYILDSDIVRAFGEAQMTFNQSLIPGGTDANIKLAYLYLTAHYLCIDIKNAQQGINSAGSLLVNSRSVGSVSESYSIPERYLKNPNIGYLATTGYGNKYLSFVLPALVGNMVGLFRQTNP